MPQRDPDFSQSDDADQLDDPPDDGASDDHAPRYSGRWAIIAVTLIASLMASYAWWHRRHSGEQALEFWGPESALLISRAPDVEIIALGPRTAGKPRGPGWESTRFASPPVTELQTKIMQRAKGVPGLNKACTILLQDNAYAWDEPADRCEPRWQYAMEFRDGERRATVLISLDCPRVKLVDREASASIRPIAEPLREFLVAQFPAQEPPVEVLTPPAAK